MELEHRFEVPVGVEKAWMTLLDMEQVGPCFPGAILDHVDGDEFSGSVKIKLGPIRMTYKGTAKIVEKDETAHRARIEATGNAGGSTSTAAMMVTATATGAGPEPDGGRPGHHAVAHRTAGPVRPRGDGRCRQQADRPVRRLCLEQAGRPDGRRRRADRRGEPGRGRRRLRRTGRRADGAGTRAAGHRPPPPS